MDVPAHSRNRDGEGHVGAAQVLPGQHYRRGPPACKCAQLRMAWPCTVRHRLGFRCGCGVVAILGNGLLLRPEHSCRRWHRLHNCDWPQQETGGLEGIRWHVSELREALEPGFVEWSQLSVSSALRV